VFLTRNNALVEHGELCLRAQLLDLIPVNIDVSYNVAVEGDCPSNFAHKRARKLIAIREDDDIRRGFGSICRRRRLRGMADVSRRKRK
jgi:hypothetical protein